MEGDYSPIPDDLRRKLEHFYAPYDALLPGLVARPTQTYPFAADEENMENMERAKETSPLPAFGWMDGGAKRRSGK
jgi:hypothetical protein